MTEFAKRVQDELDYQGKRKSDISHTLNIADSTVRSWWDKSSIPAADVALKVAEFLGVPLEYLLTGERKESAVNKDDYIDISQLGAEEKGKLREICGKFPLISEESQEDVLALVRKAYERKNKGVSVGRLA